MYLSWERDPDSKEIGELFSSWIVGGSLEMDTRRLLLPSLRRDRVLWIPGSAWSSSDKSLLPVPRNSGSRDAILAAPVVSGGIEMLRTRVPVPPLIETMRREGLHHTK